MKKVLLAGVAALAIAGSTVVYAQHRPWFHGQMRMNPEDRAAFLDARIAAVHAGLKLTADQEKLWPPVEAAVRDFAKLRIDRANARMAAGKTDADKAEKPDDPVARLRERADAMAVTAASLKKIADAADPLVLQRLMRNEKRSIAVSARTGLGIEELLALIDNELPRPSVEIEVLVPYTHGKLVARAHNEGEVISEEHTPEGTLLKVRVHEELAAELTPYVPAPALS